MSNTDILTSTLAQAARRRRLALALRGLWWGLFWCAAIWLVALGIFKLAPIPLGALAVAGAVGLACPVLGFLLGGWRRPTLPEMARWADGQAHLQERLSTALEVKDTAQVGPWRDLIMADATAHLGTLDPRRLMPFHLPRITRWTLGVLAVAAGLGFVPEYRSHAYLKKQTDTRTIRHVGQQIAAATQRELKERPPALETTQKKLEEVKTLAELLQQAKLTRSDALKSLASAQDKLKDQLKELGKEPAMKRLDEAARESGGREAQSAAEIQKQVEKLQKELGKLGTQPDAADKLKQELEKLQNAAKAMTDKDGNLSDAARAQLAQSLQQLSKLAGELGASLPDLEKALEALSKANAGMFLKDLEAATTDLEKLRDMAKNLASLQQQMEKLGKDLAEQLAKGQADLAKSTLSKMQRELQAAGLSPEQLQKLLEEIAKAVDPAKDYGECSKHLADAASKLKQGDKAGASESLAAAAKELEKLMDQFGDAQSLAQALEMLKEGAKCVGSGDPWQMGQGQGMCQSCGGLGCGRCNGRGWGHGKGFGTGVGTWGDDSQQVSLNDLSPLVDNSQVNRPDLAPRGQTDRGDGKLNPGLTATKVKGQFNPGSPMPAMPIKGLSIKGTSKVQWEEAATAAQTDAASALNQDRVPRAYQGPVKEYFDDLKK